MRIISQGIEFNLPENFEVELRRYNIMLSEVGDMTNPITLPPTPKNLKLVENSNRVDNYFKPLTDLPVIVSDGIMYGPANLGIHTADEEDGISGTIYFRTGEFYSLAADRKMGSLDWPIIKSPDYNTQNEDERVWYLIEYLVAQYGQNNTDAIFRIAPLGTSQEFTWRVNRRNTLGVFENKDVTGLFILNGFEKYQYPLNIAAGRPDELNVFEGEYIQKMKFGDDYIDVGKGYGMTPFMKLRYMMNFIFESFGYSFDSRSIEDRINEYGDDIVVANNVADAIYTGILDFSKLVPNTTIKLFVKKIEGLLAGKFEFDEVKKQVFFYSYEDIFLRIKPDMDLTQYLVAKPKLGSTDFTTVKLVDSADGTSQNDDSKIKSETIDFEFLKEVTIRSEFFAPDVPGYMLDVDLKMATIKEIVHANTDVVIDGIKVDTPDVLSAEIQLLNIKNLQEVAVTNFSTVDLSYYRSYKLFEGMADSSLLYMKSVYKNYIEFRLNSNIPITAEMDIPRNILENININTPKLLNAQPVLIESIKYTLGKKDTQKVTLRTIRSYADR